MIPWTPDLEIGEPGVDHQHREIFRRAGILAGALTQGQGREEVGRLVEYVAAYTYGHFQDEEFLMEELGYPHLAAHRQLHGAAPRGVEPARGYASASSSTSTPAPVIR
jgi:hemerythrin